MKQVFILLALAAASNSFYPACLKPDGDWVHGLSRAECKELGGKWFTQKPKQGV